MKTYELDLVAGEDDKYKVKTSKPGIILCGDQLGEKFVKLSAILEAIETCEGDLDFLKFRLEKLDV